MNSRFSTKVLLIVIRAVMVIGAFVVVSLPWTADWLIDVFRDGQSSDGTYRVFIVAFYMVIGVLVIWGLGEAQAMLATIEKGTAFSQRNVQSLKRAGFLSLATAALFIVRTVLYPEATSVLVAIAAVLVGLSCFNLSRLIATAASLKDENDLTI